MNVSNISGTRADISEILSKMREISSKTSVFSGNHGVKESNGFENVMSLAKNSLMQVNKMQAETESLKNAYITGDTNVSMSQIIVASQKSKLAFEGLLAVRNKILEAYKEIMNMPV